MTFQLADIPRILPELLLMVLALMILGSDVFERWGSDAAAQLERSRSAGSLAVLGLGMIFVIVLVQSGYVYRLPADAPVNPLTNILRNLQSGGPTGPVNTPVLGAFIPDHLTMIGRLTVIAAALLTALLALDFRPAGNPAEFYALLICATVGMCLMVGATELIVAYLAVEFTSIPLYVLTGYFQHDRRSAEAGMKYFLFGALSSGVLLYGMSLVYGYAASAATAGHAATDLTQFTRIAQLALQEETIPALLLLGMLFIIAGIGYKIAVVPFHTWSPDVYQGAPTPITAFISTASKAAGFFLLYRVLVAAFPGLTGSVLVEEPGFFGGWTSLLACLSLLTLLVGNLAALPQTNARRLLAYSSIAHAGFLLMGLVAWASPLTIDRALGTSALVYYLVVYTVTNLGAFGVLAVVMLAVGQDEIADLRGLSRRNLGLAAMFAVCLLSLAGIPPLAGFFAKFYVFMAAWQAGAWWLVMIGLVMTIVALYYYLRLLRAMFIEPPVTPDPLPIPRTMYATLMMATFLVLVLGIYPNLVLRVINQVQVTAGL